MVTGAPVGLACQTPVRSQRAPGDAVPVAPVIVATKPSLNIISKS